MIVCNICGKKLKELNDPHIKTCGNIALWALIFRKEYPEKNTNRGSG